MAVPSRVLLDDRLLIEELLGGLPGATGLSLCTTAYWYYRACRAAVLGAGGQLSGPFLRLGSAQQEKAVGSLLLLPEAIGLPDSRLTVPVMVEVARRHPRLNLLNLEAVAAAQILQADVWLSGQAAEGLLPAVLDAEGIAWRSVAVE